MIRTRTICVDASDTSPKRLAADIDDAIEAAFVEIVAAGGEVLAPVAIIPVRTSESNHRDGDYRDHRTVESGILATITYRSS